MSTASIVLRGPARSSAIRQTRVRTAAAEMPALPAGQSVYLPGRGTTFVREVRGPEGAPVVVLLHGWGATADLNWSRSYAALAEHHRVIALDHRGHGRGLRTQHRFRLEDCADDVVALADALGIDRFIPVGYSMGGPIASLVWQRHPNRVSGLVMCATSRRFNQTPTRRVAFTVLNGTSSLAAVGPFRSLGRMSGTAWSRRLERRGDDAWAVEQVMRHDWTQVLAAGQAIGRFDSRRWIGGVDVPAAVVATLDDEVVPTRHQMALAASIKHASLHVVRGGHGACSAESGAFAAAVVRACESVSQDSAAAAESVA